MIISGSVIAQKMLAEGIEIGDNVSCQLPSIEKATAEMKGAGIMGTIDMPMTGQFNSMVFTMSMRSINKNSAELIKPGTQRLELRFLRDVMMSDGSMVPQGTKIFITGVNKKYDPGKVETASTMDGSIEYEVLRYRQVIDGRETLLIDKLANVFKVNGIDYMKGIRASL